MTVKKFHVGGAEFFLPASISGNTDKSSSKTIFCFWDDGLTYVTENAVMLVENRPAKKHLLCDDDDEYERGALEFV